MGLGVEVKIGVSGLAVHFVNQRAIRSSVNIQVQEWSVAFTCRYCIQPYMQSAGPTQHQICGLVPHEIIQSPPSGQGPPRTKDTRGLEDPLRVRRAYIGQTGRSVDIRLKEHHRHVKLQHPDKSAVAEHSIDQGHCIKFHNSSILASKTRYMDRIVREATEIELHSNNINREGGFCLSKFWKPLIDSLKPLGHDQETLGDAVPHS
jgi:hypothetical protein